MDSMRQPALVGMPPQVRERLQALSAQPNKVAEVAPYRGPLEARRHEGVTTPFDKGMPSQMKDVIENGRAVNAAHEIPTLPGWLEPQKHTASFNTVVKDVTRVVPLYTVAPQDAAHVLLHASIQADNPNPHPVGLELGIVDNGKFHKYERACNHTFENTQFTHVIAPRETVGSKPIAIFNLDKANTTPFAYHFQGTPLSALRNGIREIEDTLLVQGKHPVCDIYNENAARNQWPPIMASPFPGYVIAPAKPVQMCIDTLADHIAKLDPCIEPKCQLAVRLRALPSAKPGQLVGAEPVHARINFFTGKRQDEPTVGATEEAL